MKKVIVAIAILIAGVAVNGETRLSGEIQASVYDQSGNPYIVEKDISVPSGKTLTVKEGCVFLFSGFSGFNVSGNLSIEGSDQKPVIFTCINDNEYNPKSQQLPNPFDWNGIIIGKESGSVHFRNFQLRYSVYGIKSQNSKMTIQTGIFRQNGQFHFTINDKIQYVQDNISYSYNAATPSDASADTGKPAVSVRKGGASVTRNVIRYSSLGIGVAGLVAGTLFSVQASNTNKDMDYLSQNPPASPEIGNKRWDELQSKLDTENALQGVFFALGGLGLIGFTLTFVF
jgi:hypothetical protein